MAMAHRADAEPNGAGTDYGRAIVRDATPRTQRCAIERHQHQEELRAQSFMDDTLAISSICSLAPMR